MAIEHYSGGSRVISAVVDYTNNYAWSADVYGNLTLGTHDPGEALSAVVATYLSNQFASSNIEPGGQITEETPTLVFSI